MSEPQPKRERIGQSVRHFAEAILFLAGLLFLLYAASLFFRPKTNTTAAGMRDAAAYGILAEDADSIDLLILGDSNAYSSFIPADLLSDYGISAYVCATPSQKLFYTEEFLNKAFETQHPKVVLLETDALFRDFDLSDALLSDLQDTFSVFEHHDRWKRLNADDFSLHVSYDVKQKNKGYRPSAAIRGTGKKSSPQTSEREEIPAVCKRYVEKIKADCDAHGAKLILVCAPNLKSWHYARYNSTADLAASLGLPYLDLNLLPEEVPIDWRRDTRDRGEHLNNTGAAKVTAYIGRYLTQEFGVDEFGEGGFGESEFGEK